MKTSNLLLFCALLLTQTVSAQLRFPAPDEGSAWGDEYDFPDGETIGTSTEVRDKRILVGDGETFEPWSNPDYYEKTVGRIVPHRDSRVGSATVPEPSTFALLGVGGLAFLILQRRFKHRRSGG